MAVPFHLPRFRGGPRSRASGKRFAAFRPTVPGLEERLLLSAAVANQPTDAEQYMLELVNQVRADPAAAGRQLVSLARTDPVLKEATQGEDLSLFLQEIDRFGPEPPLAFNPGLIQAATAHSQAMLAANSQFHSPPDYLTDPSLSTGNNGQAYYPSGAGSWSTGENIFAYSGVVRDNTDAAYVNYLEDAFLLDWGNPDFGHLTNILAPGPGEWSASSSHYPYSEIGIGLLTGATPTVPPPSNPANPGNAGLSVGPDIVTQEFGWRSGNPILTGAFYNDRDGTNSYAPGEGYGGALVRAVGLNGQGTFQTTTWSSGGYSLRLPAGSYTVTASGGGVPTTLSNTVTLGADNVEWEYGFKPATADIPVPGDYLGAGKDQVAVYRSATAQWYIAGAAQSIPFGGPGIDVPEPGDYDGVRRTEIAVYRPSTSQWFVRNPSGVGRSLGTFGAPGLDVPVPDDYEGVGRTEVAVYRPSTAQWFVLGPSGFGHKIATFGGIGDVPSPADYDGLGHAEVAVYRPTTGQWFVLGPGGTHIVGSLGGVGDIPVPGDYDGVGHDEPAVYRPSTGQWFILGPTGVRVVAFGGANSDRPLRGDFDGDGRTDLAVYRPSTAQWFLRTTSKGDIFTQFGQGGTSPPVSSWLPNTVPTPASAAVPSRATPQAGWSARLSSKSVRASHPQPAGKSRILPGPFRAPRRPGMVAYAHPHR